MMDPDYPHLIAVAFIGLIHGLEPGHGWVPAAALSLRGERRYLRGLAASLIISAGHFLSSLLVVALYLAAAVFIDLQSPLFRYLAAALLIALAVRFLTERIEEDGESPRAVSLRGVVLLAVALGFAHEEEFMILGFMMGGVEPLLLLVVYSLSVTLSITSLTLLAIRTYSIVERRVKGVARYAPRITGVVLAAMGVLFLLGL